MRLTTLAWLSSLLCAQVASADVIVPKPGADWSAYRVDCEVFGWDVAYTQVAAACLWTKREPLGRTRGEGLLVVFPVDSVQAIHNVQVKFVTQPDLPHDPVPLPYAKDNVDMIDFDYAKMWPKRPAKKQPRGAMSVELLWDKVEVEPKVCNPAVGFVLRWKNELRVQPHKPLHELKADCAALRMTGSQTYWARQDIAVTQPRFEYSPSKNEQSFRHPVSALWKLARPVTLRLRTSLPPSSPEVSKAKAALAHYGKVTVQTDSTVATSEVLATSELAVLGQRVASELALPRTLAAPSGTDLEILLAPPASPSQTPEALPSWPRSVP